MDDKNKVREVIKAALHGDKEEVLKEQHDSIEQEIQKREKIDVANVKHVEEDIVQLHNEILGFKYLDGENLRETPDQRRDRLNLVKVELDLTKELRLENRDTWKDVQVLKQEERVVEKELTTLAQRKKRYDEIL
jgi:hypothetical protein